MNTHGNQQLIQLIQQLIVGVVVLWAFVHVFKRYAPKMVRQYLRQGAVRFARGLGWAQLARKWEAAAENGAACATGCGSCGGCGSGGSGGGGSATARRSEERYGTDRDGMTRNSITPDALRRTIKLARPM